ncbi:Nucleotidyltransferase [Dentipellis sp. KUC8613]|nr:Nucleotidyltransferase [Dentipellis sp. KUC8613]
MSLLARIGPSSQPAGPAREAGEFEQGSSRPRSRKRKRMDREKEDEEPVPLEKQLLHTPWLEDLAVSEGQSKEQRLHDEIVAFARYILPTQHEIRAREILVSRIRSVLTRRFRNSTVNVYGSVSTNLCLPTGDIDLVIDLPHTDTAKEKGDALFQIRAALARAGLVSRIFVNTRPRVPVLTMVSSADTGALPVDITVNGADGVQAIALVQAHLVHRPALRTLVLLLKALLERHALQSAATGGLSSYALTAMVISMLQTNPMERTAEVLERPLESKSFGTLLLDFLKYYADDFPYETSCISVSSGGLVSKESKGWGDAAHAYKLAVECLVNPENDIAKATGKIRAVRELFRESRSALDTADVEATKHNILGTILRLPQETLDNRERLRRLMTASGSDDRAPRAQETNYASQRASYSYGSQETSYTSRRSQPYDRDDRYPRSRHALPPRPQASSYSGPYPKRPRT